MDKVLIVEDEEHARTGLTELVESWGYRASSASNGLEGLEKVIQWLPTVVVTDLKMPRMDGMSLLNRITEMPERIAVVMLTAQGSIESAVEAMRLGAYDYLPKPVDPLRLKQILQSATLQKETDVEMEPQRRLARDSGTLGAMVGATPAMKAIFKMIERVAPSNVPVLITGESGTGKELVARALHDLSVRRTKPFVAVNLRRDTGDTDRERDLRSREGRVHRCHRTAGGMLRTGRRGDAAAGRDWRDAGGNAGKAAARA